MSGLQEISRAEDSDEQCMRILQRSRAQRQQAKSSSTWARPVTSATVLYKFAMRKAHAASFVLLSSNTLNLTTMASSFLDRGPSSILKRPFQWDSHPHIMYPTSHIKEYREQLVRKYSKRRRHESNNPSSTGSENNMGVQPEFPVEEYINLTDDLQESETNGLRVRMLQIFSFLKFVFQLL